MLFSRIVYWTLRIFEFIFAVLVVGFSSWFLQVRHTHDQGAKGRLVFVICISVWSLVLSMVWLVPFTANFLHYPLDAFTSIFYFVSFAILQEWIYKYGCARIFDWNGEYHMDQCQTYRAMIAFCFIAGVFWLASALLDAFVFHRLGTMKRTPRNVAFERETTGRTRRMSRGSSV
ncbi:hypothetical protein FKW77_006943 [Venturia effusa]|uniref:MARVEL domain-containing protein n=1 Tax=Venturia effusa TaxID=50376 RepID=A0A517LPE0_9PEZI|nr:hypothetical protein FKW77_006943 [Venturia effusa]